MNESTFLLLCFVGTLIYPFDIFHLDPIFIFNFHNLHYQVFDKLADNKGTCGALTRCQCQQALETCPVLVNVSLFCHRYKELEIGCVDS